MWQFPSGERLRWGDRTYLMGVLNVTPDSFSDGGDFVDTERALEQAHYLVRGGADILDIGGQSTRPQADNVSLDEESQRVLPAIRAIRQGTEGFAPLSTIISVDTTKAAIARAAVEAGANIINDISGATYDPDMLPTVAELGVPIILMHIRGTPKTMQQFTEYGDLMEDIADFLAKRIEVAIAQGIPREHIAVDPGIGFAKTADQNLDILRQLPKLKSLDCPILVGPSRKSFIGKLLNQPDPKQRVWGTAAACYGAIAGGADILRVHDAAPMRDVCRVADAVVRGLQVEPD
ncbi:dihydropteroate synthase [Vacuolonema iberomarrocanum]|uniref:dihydropteroate synthase n=1 Tax=Vacuolonema iberomarrocanum TaxID=3454632 RepID=UPI001A0527CD|nr:dihydropteroate synthase [filamentous cyanobacterium LEGE 07170]